MCETTSSLDISVVIPVHNVADYLEECLSSLHCQTLQSAEFIVINDGSTDGCAQICDKYSKLDARFKVVHQDSRGTLVARKRAFAMSKGKWCICVDGDDKLPFNRVLEIEVALANKIDVDILRFDMDAISEKGEKVQKELSFKNEWIGTVYSPYEIIKKIFEKGEICWGMANKIYRSSVVKKAIQDLEEPFLICGTDTYQFFLICFYSSTFESIKTEPLYLYRLGTGISNGEPSAKKFCSQAKVLTIPNFLENFLQKKGEEEKYKALLSKLKTRLLRWTLAKFHDLPLNNDVDVFTSLFVNPNIKLEVLQELEKLYFRDPARLARKIENSILIQPCKRKIKRIGIFYSLLYAEDGEHVLSNQVSLLLAQGFELFVLVEEVYSNCYFLPKTVRVLSIPRESGLERNKILEKALDEHNIDLVIYHDSSSPKLLFDLLTVKLAGKYFVIYRHELTTQFLLWKSTVFTQFVYTHKLADALIVLNSMEQFYYRSYGVPALYIPNPIIPVVTHATNLDNPRMDLCRQENVNRTKHIVWIGRLENTQKNYKEALEIFRSICKSESNVICHVVGVGKQKEDEKFIKDFIFHYELGHKIIYEACSFNAEKFFKIADIQLITSTFECFPMSLVEGKLHGIPAVLYEMPYLELLKNKKGYIAVPRHDIAKASAAICELLRNETKRHKLGLDSRSSIDEYVGSNPTHTESWQQLISHLEETQTRCAIAPNQDFINFAEVVFSFCQEGFKRTTETSKKQSEISRRADYEQKKIDRYDVCRNFILRFCPAHTLRYRASKFLARAIYRTIKNWS